MSIIKAHFVGLFFIKEASMLFNDRYSLILSSPLGTLGLILQESKLIRLELLTKDDGFKIPKDTLSRHITNQFSLYFNDPLHKFDLNINPLGTPFQQSAWEAMCTIPSGKTLSYGQLSKQLKTGPRAIGQACRTNPLPIIIPCHRIVGATDIGGYSGAKNGRWLEVKKWLLTHEKSI
jgi:methylated-DNA-[protein]-cysteine S-methyltransferase